MRRFEKYGIAALLLLGVGLAFTGEPTLGDRMAWIEPEIAVEIAERTPFIDPGELLELKHNRDVRCILIDVRSDADYNRFHVIDAIRVDIADSEGERVHALKPDWIKVLMSNDEAAAVEVYRRLRAQGIVNVYVLAGGVNLWLDVFRDGRETAPIPVPPGDDTLRHTFDESVGDRIPAANPDPYHPPAREFERKVKIRRASKGPTGGCG